MGKSSGKSGGKKKCGWIERIRAEGAVPYQESQNSSNCYCSPPGSAFKVRGSDYLRTKVKIPGGEYLLQPLGFDWVKGSVKIGEILRNPNNTVRKIIAEEFPDSDNRPFIWAFNLQLPTKDNYSAVMYFASKEPFPEGSLVDKFLKGDDASRNLRLKLIANIVKGPWIVKRAVGEQAICIIGKALTCKYCVRPNFMEVDIDIGSSMVATAIVHLAFGYVKTLTVDLAFLLEGQAQSELPEKLLGALRLCSLDPASAIPVEPSPSLSSDSLQRSLSRRLWRSLGQMILPSSREDDSPPSSASQGATKKDIDVKKW